MITSLYPFMKGQVLLSPRAYKSFFSSHNFSGALRMTAGILLPSLLLGYYNLLDTGIVISMGAFLVSVTDNPGPIHHRRNGMMACLVGILLLSFIAGLASQNPYIYGILLIVFAFLGSMAGVYGARAGSVGIATLLAFILVTQNSETGFYPALNQSLLMASGGLWYLCLSMLLYNFRPYMLAQQTLGECIQELAEYLRIRADFYRPGADYGKISERLLSQQALINEKQASLAEIILKTRHIVKETTLTSRMIMMMYLDLDDMFEKITTSYQRYSLLHKYFDENDILQDYRNLALLLADELEETGIAIKSRSSYFPTSQVKESLEATNTKLEMLRLQAMNAENIEGFISLKRIINNLHDLAKHIKTIQLYANNDPSINYQVNKSFQPDKLINPQSINKVTFADNLTLQSEIFRHSLRVTISLLAGFFVSLLFVSNHSYWILLTITVILKPAYSLTKKRNIDRLLGTGTGILLGVILVRGIDNDGYLLAAMILLMVGTYTYMRTNYLVNVLLMTSYLIIFFHFLYPGSFKEMLVERIVDTTIGSAIAFTASFFILPLWQKQMIKPLMVKMLQEANAYFKIVSHSFIKNNNTNEAQKKWLRKNAMVALANLTDTFNRMLNEPQSQQSDTKHIHRFVVLNQMFIGYVASFSQTSDMQHIVFEKDSLEKVSLLIEQYLDNSEKLLQMQEETVTGKQAPEEALQLLHDPANRLMEKRKEELEAGLLDTETRKPLFQTKSVVDQFTFIFQTAAEIYKTSKAMVK
jgi:uncharacterized membrane protein YccC